jgi:hypothetical protein
MAFQKVSEGFVAKIARGQPNKVTVVMEETDRVPK